MNAESGYSPEHLAHVDEVEVVDLRGVFAPSVSKYMGLPGLKSVMVSGENAQQIADAWRCLPAGEQLRCHTPPFGVRFRAGGHVSTEASICWECNNIYGCVGGNRFHYQFNAIDDSSKKLLVLLKQTVGVQL